MKVKNHGISPFWKSISVIFVCYKDKEAVVSTCSSTLSYCHFFFAKTLSCTCGFTSPTDGSRICRVHFLYGKSYGWRIILYIICCTFYIFTFKSLDEDGILVDHFNWNQNKSFSPTTSFCSYYYPNIIIVFNNTLWNVLCLHNCMLLFTRDTKLYSSNKAL